MSTQAAVERLPEGHVTVLELDRPGTPGHGYVTRTVASESDGPRRMQFRWRWVDPVHASNRADGEAESLAEALRQVADFLSRTYRVLS